MKVGIHEDGFSVKLSGAEALILLEELGDFPARKSPKIRQLYADLTTMLHFSGKGAIGHELLAREQANARAERKSDLAREKKAQARAQAQAQAQAQTQVAQTQERTEP